MSNACQDGKTSKEVIYLKLFPFSLKDKAKVWFNALAPMYVLTWLDLQAKFLKKLFPLHRTQALKRQISTFCQRSSETFYEVWERYKELLLACLHHGYDQDRTIGFFYEALNPASRSFLQMMCNGEFY